MADFLTHNKQPRNVVLILNIKQFFLDSDQLDTQLPTFIIILYRFRALYHHRKGAELY
jgi:hypothetical protein